MKKRIVHKNRNADEVEFEFLSSPHPTEISLGNPTEGLAEFVFEVFESELLESVFISSSLLEAEFSEDKRVIVSRAVLVRSPLLPPFRLVSIRKRDNRILPVCGACHCTSTLFAAWAVVPSIIRELLCVATLMVPTCPLSIRLPAGTGSPEEMSAT